MSSDLARARSSSRKRSPSRSSKSSRRRPLHQRSDSQTNERASPTASNADPADFQKPDPPRAHRDVFPRLPSHFLAPTASSSIDIYEDSTASPVFNLVEAQPPEETPPRPYRRSRSEKGKARKKASPTRKVPDSSTWNAPRLPFPSPTSPTAPAFSPSSLVSLRRAQLEELDAAARREEDLRRHQLSSRPASRSVKSRNSFRSIASSPRDQSEFVGELHDHAFLQKYQSLIREHFQSAPSSTELPSASASRHLRNQSQRSLKELTRPRSRSSGHLPDSRPSSTHVSRPSSRRSRKDDFEIALQKPLPEHAHDDEDLAEDPASSPSRPRSVSMPPQDTEAMIEALLSDGVGVQYPVLQKPSVASMRSETSSTRRAYPKPLRLSRKKGNPQLVMSASRPGGTSRSSSDRSPRLIPATANQLVGQPSLSALSIPEHDTPDYAIDFADGPDLSLAATEDAYVSGFTDELGDTLGELAAPHLLRTQRSMNRSSYSSLNHRLSLDALDSRPTTSSSQTSSRTFFYNFLNNSRVAWARAYYTGEERLSLESPSVTDVTATPASLMRTTGSHKTLGQDSWSGSLVRDPGSWTTITGRSSSPSSTGYPDQIYVPRIRPMIHPDTSSVVISSDNESLPDADPLAGPSNHFSYAPSDRTPSIQEAKQARRQRAHSWHASDGPEVREAGAVHAVPVPRAGLDPPFNPMRMPQTPRLPTDKRKRNTLYSWTAPSLDDTRSPLSPINRQFWLLVLGFVFPIAWMIGALLPLPARPHWRREPPQTQADEPQIESGLGGLWDSLEIRRWKKAQRWRIYNRFMSVVGVAVIAIVVSPPTVSLVVLTLTRRPLSRSCLP